MRLLYNLAMYLFTPLVMLRLMARGMRYGDYHLRWRERFGTFSTPRLNGCLWVHAVSVGEVNAAEPLVKALMVAYPQAPMLVTTVTPTGSERVRQLFGDSVYSVYLPYDLPFAVRRFLRSVRPRLAIIVETEIWPNLYFACRRHGIPLLIANARLSERSLRGYARMRSLVRKALRCVSHIAAQSRTDAARYRLLGAEPSQLTVCGNLKFDMPVPCDALADGTTMRATWGAGRPVWIAASTHEGEELAVLQAHLEVLRRIPDALLLIAPRHPERFRAVEASIRSLGFQTGTRSGDGVPSLHTQCFVIDAMGELLRFFAASDVAFVGGSLVPIGGHNVLEPAALGKPVLVGPNTFNFEEITQALLDAGGGERVATPESLGEDVLRLLRDEVRRKSMGEAARKVFDSERGSVERVMKLVDNLLQE
ncbi:3-deoxy-D-manno-octulosonic-acid transferase [Luteibacter rhizovicinus]|uniref:3-deoxy-D-manno-octulosonic acid transferase n=1 Tax=Luteibacter rhizovicinus TaxID=242606 RepID=A0A4R3YJB3_9GAMM|nr:lipid IV(A) 3-deoxy-D-manno-octulosonic acid transferase [Luteibacter rhizovicinus]TCV92152.1 3-deoxy-D-manno-octulosonic-acid transferase [Luteibacter rhizovicinus]